MTPPDTHDLIIIGAGPGGTAAALEAAQRGARVALVERDRPGGTCLNWGCIPTKALLATAEIARRASMGPAMGLMPCEVTVDWKALQSRRAQIIDRLVQAHLSEFKREGVEFIEGTARVTGRGQVEVRERGGATREIRAPHLILATGSRPGSLPGLEPDGTHVLNSDHALSLEALPSSLLILGGGVIGCEFASLFADMGVEVEIVEALDALLALTDADAETTKELARVFRKRRIRMQLGAKVEHIEIGAGGVTAHLEGGKTARAERALLSIGRRLNTDGLGLETIGLTPARRGEIPVDEHLATATKDVYAIGDITGQPQLAHLATHHGIVAARHALGQTDARIDLTAVPSVVFTHPCLASVGLSEAAAVEAGHDVAVGKIAARLLGKAHVAGELDGLVKVVADRGSGRLLGVHLVGAGAEDQIAEATLAVRLGLTLRQLADTIHPHPTMSEGIWEAVAAALR
ncbi:dihydrolipoyl dehydrogenase [Candidatus Sumerlaeota bacterium]|nr:dihydrolipoyl dehydrogenase [Candidatus Sumerlaeota bacterium]